MCQPRFMSSQYWETRYQSGDMPWEKGEPSPGLVDFIAQHPELERGSVLVPGCGTGHDARVWAKAGFSVTGMDLAPSAMRLAREKTAAAGLTAQFQPGDFLRDEPHRRFDWVFEHTLFCAIQIADRHLYVEAVRRWLSRNGNYVAVFYMIDEKDGPPFGTKRDELIERFSPHFDLKKEWVPRSYPNRTGLELMMWWRKKP
jgi:SAM-dependent methyltransferase